MSKSFTQTVLVCALLVVAYVCVPAPARAQSPPTSGTAQPSPGPTPAPKQDTQIINSAQPPPLFPLSAGAKMKRALRLAFLSPAGYAFTGIGAAITEAGERDQPQKDSGDRVADGGTRFAINFATRAANTLLGAGVYPVLFKQDPRYRPSGKHGFGARAAYAASRVFVTAGDDGRAQPNISRLGGNLTASALANVWERNTPGHTRIGVRPTFRRFGYYVGFGMLGNIVFKEFWPDIRRKLGKK